MSTSSQNARAGFRTPTTVSDKIDRLSRFGLTRRFLAAAAISEGDVVCLDTNASNSVDRLTHVIKIPVSVAGTKGIGGVMGVAASDAAAETELEVYTAGFCPKINCATSVAAFEELITSSAVAGRAISFGVTGSFNGTVVAMPFGYAIGGETSNFTTGWIFPRGF